MISSIGQCIALTTHANAAISGREVELDISTHPWFQFVAESRFGQGEDRNRVFASNPSDWFGALQSQGWQRAYLWMEPHDGKLETIDKLAFAGAARWAPVTAQPDLEVIWHERIKHDKETSPERPWFIWRGGFRVMPGQHTINSTAEDAAIALDIALRRMLSFAGEHRATEPSFAEAFQKSLEHLSASGLLPQTEASGFKFAVPEQREAILSLFPPDLYPATSIDLVAAVNDAWVLGGMGWWNDWSSKDPEVQDEFAEATNGYYVAMSRCLFAACDVRLS